VIDVQTDGTFDVSLVPGGFVLEPAQTLKGNGIVIGDVTAKGTIAPGASLGNLSFNNSLTLSGANLSMEVDKSLTPSNDVITVGSTLTATGFGTVTVANVGGTPLVAGDTFQIFSQPVVSGSALAVFGNGVVWTNNLEADGSIGVAGAAVRATNVTIVQVS